MDHRATNVSCRASFRQAGFRGFFFWGFLLFSSVAPARVDAQQGVLPPFVKDLAAVGVPITPQQQPVNPGADSRIPAGDRGSDPNHVFDKNVAVDGAAPAAAAAPTILVLRNGRVVRGTVRADSRGYFVDSPRSSLYFPFEHVKFVAADLHEAYVKLCDSIAGSSARRDLVLGRWCLENELRPEAADHFRNVLNFEPANREARQALAALEQRQSEEPRRRGAGRIHPGPRRTLRRPYRFRGSPAGRAGVRDRNSADPALPLRQRQMPWSRRLQLGGRSPSFRLEHVRLSQGSNRAATARNLDAVLNLLDGQFPSQSRLFQKGLQPHGGLDDAGPARRAVRPGAGDAAAEMGRTSSLPKETGCKREQAIAGVHQPVRAVAKAADPPRSRCRPRCGHDGDRRRPGRSARADGSARRRVDGFRQPG